MAEMATLKAPLAGGTGRRHGSYSSSGGGGGLSADVEGGRNSDGGDKAQREGEWTLSALLCAGHHERTGLDQPPQSLAQLIMMAYWDLHYTLGGYVDNDFDRGEYSGWALYNPFYWVWYVIMWPYLVLGYIYHWTRAQGHKVRDDENETEKAVRVLWIYCAGGVVFLSLKISIVELILGIFLQEAKLVVEAIYTLVVCTSLLEGNVCGYRAMGARNHHDIGVFIVATASFILALLVVYLGEMANYIVEGSASAFSIWTLCERSLIIILYFKETINCYELWNLYPDPSTTTSTSKTTEVIDPQTLSSTMTTTTTTTRTTVTSPTPPASTRNTVLLSWIVVVVVLVTAGYAMVYWTRTS